MKKKVMIGMSGGVDSSVAAWLLREQGYEVIGVTFKLWGGETQDSKCCGVDDVSDARYVCHQLDIPHYVFNYKELFREKVVDAFVREYEAGRTPNPCILCNRYIKLEEFSHRAAQLGVDYIATGHYAQVARNVATGRYELKKGAYPEKDQSYVLYTLTQDQLARLLLPCGGYAKEEIRQMAAENGLIVAQKPDSQDICFVPDGDYAAFLEEYTGRPNRKGHFVDKNGRVLGEHKGIGCYTVGQRKGLGIALGQPMFVSAISPEANTVTLVEDEELLFGRQVTASEVNYISIPELTAPMAVTARIRYSQKLAPALAEPLPGGKVRITFEEPQRAATSGQAVVFYDGDRVVGGGTID